MTKDDENKFHGTGIQFMKKKFLPGTKVQAEVKKTKELENEPADEVTKTDIERATKQQAWSTIRTTGDVQIGDIIGIGPKKREELADSGFWSTSDVYKAWKDGNIDELVLAFKGVRNKRDVIASTILSAPEASTTLTKKDILDSLPETLPTRGQTFLERREKEIKEYLGKLNVDGKVPVKVTIQDEGERFTQEKVEELLEPSQKTSPVPIILTESKIIRGISAQKRKAKNRIFEQGVRNAMTGVERGKIKTATAFKKFFDTLKNRNQKFQTDNKAFNKAKNSFITGVIDVFKKDGVFINDPDTKVLRPSDVEMARTLLSDKKMQVQIGQTNNFQIPTLKDDKGDPITVLLPASKLGNAKPGQLVFQSARSNSVEPIRLTGHMSIESGKDIDNLVKVLGANPKNGFIPKGYEHTDDIVKQLMNTFNVIVTYPPKLSINTPRITSVKKLKDKYIIRTDTNDEVWKNAGIQLWIAENGETEELQALAREETLDIIARENFNKPYDQLTKAEIKSLAIDPDLLPSIWGLEHEYGGTLCQVDPKASVPYKRLKALKNDIESLSSIEKSPGSIKRDPLERTPVKFVNEQKRDIVKLVDDEFERIIDGIEFTEEFGEIEASVEANDAIMKLKQLLTKDMLLKDAVEKKKTAILELIDKKMFQILENAKKSTGSINPYSMPNCLLVPQPSKNKVTVKTGDGSGYVEAKLDKAIARCSVLPAGAREQCFVDTVKITQNFTGDVLGSRVYSAIRSAKDADDRREEKEDIKFLSSIEHKIRTGKYKDEFIDGKLEEIKPTRDEKRQALNRAKLLGKMPLDTARWDFLSDL